MSERPTVTIALVTYNSAALLPDCLAALPAAMDGIEQWRLVVFDNDSRDATLEVVAHDAPDALVIAPGRNAGYAVGINAAIDALPSDAVLALNPDARLAPGSVARLFAALQRPGVGVAVPSTRDADGSLDHTRRREPTISRALGEALLGGTRAGRFPRWGEVELDPASYEREGPVDWAVGAVMLMARACLDDVGPWDDSFFLYSEETDFSLRVRDHGWEVRFVPEAVVTHLGGESGVSPRLWTLLTLNRVRLYRKRHGAWASGAFWAAVALNEGLRLRHGETHREAWRALLHGPTRVDRELAKRIDAQTSAQSASRDSNTPT
ncbi:MAG: Polypeptide N-acetylgalactosaminyltransferase 5 [Actinomycetia bacterium]|nr:Polypeptide N-acetylgalactosaminyltransferase 5 [Actinomycetes bacterium]